MPARPIAFLFQAMLAAAVLAWASFAMAPVRAAGAGPAPAALAARLRHDMTGKTHPSAELAAFARQLTAGLPDAHACALALSDWVRRHVRPGGKEAGDDAALDATVARPAAAVLASRTGNGVERAILLQAMLEAVGLRSTTALVNHGSVYTVPDRPTLAVFNHMLVHVPGLGLYLDPSGNDDRPGALAPALLGKPALLLESGTFAMTPLMQPHQVVVTGTVDVGSDGSNDQAALHHRPQVLQARGLATTDAARSGVHGAVSDLMRERDRHENTLCPAIDVEDRTEFRLAPDLRILALPPSVTVVRDGLYYQAQYTPRPHGTADKPAILVSRRLSFRHGLPTCTPAEYRALRPALARIRRDLGGRIVVAAP